MKFKIINTRHEPKENFQIDVTFKIFGGIEYYVWSIRQKCPRFYMYGGREKTFKKAEESASFYWKNEQKEFSKFLKKCQERDRKINKY